MLDGLSFWTDSNLDFYQAHWYQYMASGDWCARCRDFDSVRAQFGLQKPLVIGEFYDNSELAMWNDWYAKGYAGAWAWSLFAERTSDNLTVDLADSKAFASSKSDEGPKSLTSPTPVPTATATRTPTAVPTATSAPTPSCTAPEILTSTDTDASGAGDITFDWAPVSGATGYRVARREGTAWVIKATVFGTSYSGVDAADDPQWRIYAVSGSCTPLPGPATAFDPAGIPDCTPPAITSDSDTIANGAGVVTFSWSPVEGAMSYRIARREGTAWVIKGTVSGTSYSGADAADDPQWRVYVASGSCKPVPGPATAFDPT
jgi:hypothetical protein